MQCVAVLDRKSFFHMGFNKTIPTNKVQQLAQWDSYLGPHAPESDALITDPPRRQLCKNFYYIYIHISESYHL